MFKVLTLCIGGFLFTQCASPKNMKSPTIKLDSANFHTYDGDTLPYTKWDAQQKPETVIIAVHGISGAISDFRPLANHTLENLPKVAIYGAETRGQGKDPIKQRRGHIQNRQDWFKDLTTFTSLVRKKHPQAKIVWCGESMGSLIVLHSYAYAEDRENLCDALILSSPIVDIRGDFPRWKISAVNTIAWLFPKIRISLESLGGDDEVRITKDTIHTEQANTNSYHVKKHTLKLLTTLGNMMLTSKQASQKLNVPTLILHAGKDVFSDPKDVESFIKSIPKSTPVTEKFYAESYHLLFHDHQSDLVVSDIAAWVKKLK